MSYILVNWQHNEGKCSLILKNIILLVKNLNKYWDIAREVRRKFISGGDKSLCGGESKTFGWEGHPLLGGNTH